MDADLILSDARVDDNGRPVPLTPTPAPALTDEQVDQFRDDLAFIYEGEYNPQPRREAFDHWLAAVIARAKREERADISRMCDDYRARLYADERYRETTKPARDALAWVTAKLRHREADHG